ncbi:bifunctional ADP-dependent NAD(P)H-hydrate dehydratase/NAD(P)H-hydrate epimerase [uncultured Kocuria sp.]|uniref:NAD(P)H-hydrate epimerase n=1 Tax=uncultured Kocuria sp. TaxID=259305 RepID=UPI00259A31AF|nr:bifunctional ADP-dependent NAD(P)H-hydrate dehydratase/NAD(P)H-hydrate epimerase [uncultured Kocuria sp.]MCT1367277.1 bifunctional ADP-dependent NAD(P)H-hydrate dehydratase/NAD(P)H-hydrate epimerase [Rothia sp. p3-SID1597]
MGLRTYSVRQIRDVEAPALEAGEPLMERASKGLGEATVRMLSNRTKTAFGKEAVLLVGKGNNGGDALFAGAYMRSKGVQVTAVLVNEQCHEQGREALEKAGGKVFHAVGTDGEALVNSAVDLSVQADVIIDGLVGTGGRGALRGVARQIVEGLRARLEEGDCAKNGRQNPYVIACDVPSGLDATTGEALGPVLPADLTVTFIGATSGLVATPHRSLVGRVVDLPIGLADQLPEPTVHALYDRDFSDIWPLPREGDHKYTRGVLGTVVGSDEYPGAGLMCIRTALNSGVGMVRYTGGDSFAGLVGISCPEAVRTSGVGAHRVQAWAIGSGATGRDREVDIREAIDSGLPLVADAAALDMLARDAADGRPAKPHVIMTPHAGELAQSLEWFVRLHLQGDRKLRDAACDAGMDDERFPEDGFPSRSEIEECPLVWARAAQKVLGGTILLKGSTTIVAGPTKTWAHSGNSGWLATAGSGDTLTGILGAGIAAWGARAEAGEANDDDSWGRVAAGALLIQRRMSCVQPGPVPPSIAASRIPDAIAHLMD